MTSILLKQILSLPVSEKKELIRRLELSLDGLDGVRCTELLEIFTQVTGWRVNLYSRDRDCVWAKTMVAYQMFQEGYPLCEIARQMFKDHTTVTHYRQKMEDALSLPQAYQDILPIWEQFKQRLDNDIHQGSDGSPLQV